LKRRTSAPAPTIAIPIRSRPDGRSFKNTNANNAASSKSGLSTATTFDAEFQIRPDGPVAVIGEIKSSRWLAMDAFIVRAHFSQAVRSSGSRPVQGASDE
jgi:hypothetical protein